MSTTLTALAGLLPPSLRIYAKAILPAVGAMIAVLLQYLNTGTFDDTAMATAITGLGAALVAFHTSNSHDLLHDEELDVPGADDLGLSLGNYPAPPAGDGFTAASPESTEEPIANGPRV